MTKTEFQEIAYHLSLSHNMQAQPCLKSSEDEETKTIEVYLGGTDEDKEGTWTTLYSRETIEVRSCYCEAPLLSPLSSTCPGESTVPTLTGRDTTVSRWSRR